jgi:hypothetical protein
MQKPCISDVAIVPSGKRLCISDEALKGDKHQPALLHH